VGAHDLQQSTASAAGGGEAAAPAAPQLAAARCSHEVAMFEDLDIAPSPLLCLSKLEAGGMEQAAADNTWPPLATSVAADVRASPSDVLKVGTDGTALDYHTATPATMLPSSTTGQQSSSEAVQVSAVSNGAAAAAAAATAAAGQAVHLRSPQATAAVEAARGGDAQRGICAGHGRSGSSN
jgi:hypothetical protein